MFMDQWQCLKKKYLSQKLLCTRFSLDNIVISVVYIIFIGRYSSLLKFTLDHSGPLDVVLNSTPQEILHLQSILLTLRQWEDIYDEFLYQCIQAASRVWSPHPQLQNISSGGSLSLATTWRRPSHWPRTWSWGWSCSWSQGLSTILVEHLDQGTWGAWI